MAVALPMKCVSKKKKKNLQDFSTRFITGAMCPVGQSAMATAVCIDEN
jgi:hypothetical protein